MTFDEWWDSDPSRARFHADSAARACWEAAQKEAAKRCADLVLACAGDFYGDNAIVAIRREFNLDK